MILIVGWIGHAELLVCPAFPVGSRVGPCGGWSGGADQWRAVSDGVAPQRKPVLGQGQWGGRCRTGLRGGRAKRAGMVTMRAAQGGAAGDGVGGRRPGSPAARSRLWAIAAQASQAAVGGEHARRLSGAESVLFTTCMTELEIPDSASWMRLPSAVHTREAGGASAGAAGAHAGHGVRVVDGAR